ncbi:TPA: hypothetical protein QDB28_002064 [Burkholderia vietnamiensis]|uniref:hypothetical protein n=1 Tax=Burkholderia vietnamiensis TaxID=60552 RepID=UPI00158D668A|nr:hypothetical protein [Burkholderia vietnamiensis]HDR9161699.1 hypothetical protein [Burkholderia vietnamiensis]
MKYFEWYEDVNGEYSCSRGNKYPVRQFYCYVEPFEPSFKQRTEDLFREVQEWSTHFYNVKSDEVILDPDEAIQRGEFVFGWNFMEPRAFAEERDSYHYFAGQVGCNGNASIERYYKIVVYLYDDVGTVAFKLRFM